MCWGWIDSVPRKIDDARTATRISPRSPKSAWSAVNKTLVAKARKTGAMRAEGEAAIARAVGNGMWHFLDDVDALIVPGDLAAALGPARTAWDRWPRSSRRAWLERIKSAKAEATRGRRIADCAAAARADAPKAGLA